MLNGKMQRILVVGAGNGGLAMAGHLGLMGFPVTLYNRSQGRLAAVAKSGGVSLHGRVEGFGPIEFCTTSMGEALSDAAIIMVATPATAHGAIAQGLAPFLRDDQVIVLNPGRTGGALEVHKILRDHGRSNLVAETQTFVYASRTVGPGYAYIFQIKHVVPVAAIPARGTRHVVRRLRQAYPQFIATRSVLHTSLDNIGAIFHPAPLVLNAGKVESGMEFDYYHEGVTPSVAEVMERIDRERIAVAAAFGVRLSPARQWLRRAYGAKGATLYEAIQNNVAYKGLQAPKHLKHRYILEEVPTGLVPLSAFGQLCRVPTPYIDSLIQLASGLQGLDFRRTGRSLARLGLSSLSSNQVIDFVRYGRLAAPVLPGSIAGEPSVVGHSFELGLEAVMDPPLSEEPESVG